MSYGNPYPYKEGPGAQLPQWHRHENLQAKRSVLQQELYNIERLKKEIEELEPLVLKDLEEWKTLKVLLPGG